MREGLIMEENLVFMHDSNTESLKESLNALYDVLDTLNNCNCSGVISDYKSYSTLFDGVTYACQNIEDCLGVMNE